MTDQPIHRPPQGAPGPYEPLLLDAGSLHDLTDLAGDLVPHDRSRPAGPWVMTWRPDPPGPAAAHGGAALPEASITRCGDCRVVTVETLPDDRTPAEFFADCESACAGAEGAVVRMIVLVVDRPVARRPHTPAAQSPGESG